MRHGQYPGLGPGAGHRPELMENKIAAQVAEMERLRRENQRLASTHVALREDLVATQQETQRLQAHIGSIQTESDIQIRMLLEKIKKMEVDIRVGENMKNDLQQADKEAQNLVTTRQDLLTEIQQATQELRKALVEIEQLPELHADLNKLRQEHQRLRAAFEHEKGVNMEQVDKLRAREQNLISMAREVEKLRAEVLNVEKRGYAPTPYGVAFSNLDSSYPPPTQDGGVYIDGYGRPQIQMGGEVAGNGVHPYGTPVASNSDVGLINVAAVASSGNGAVPGGGAWG